MPEKTSNLVKNKPTKDIKKWGKYVLIALILESLAIGGAYFISESKTKIQTEKLDSLANLIDLQSNKIKHLEQLATSVSVLSSNISQNNGSIKLLEDSLKSLTNEVGNKKVEGITKEIENIAKRIESIEETKSTEALILSVALIIKENAIYGRGYKFETEVLEKMASANTDLTDSIAVIKELNNKPIMTDDILKRDYFNMIENFSFEKKESKTETNDEDKNTVSRSIKMIKETVAGINFDKVLVIKKDNHTEEQKNLLANLEKLVNNYHFEQALHLINDNQVFFDSGNMQFVKWYEDLKDKVVFDKAISRIISLELNVLREEISPLDNSN